MSKFTKKRFWVKVGVEMEGGWVSNPDAFLEYSHLVDVKTDGSVRVPGKHAKEVTLGPYDRVDRMTAAMGHCYPDEVNSTCGLHVHASFTPKDAARLTAPAFFTHFRWFWKEWGRKQGVKKSSPFWARLAGKNEFCQDKPPIMHTDSWYDPPITSIRLERYSQVNFCAYAEHGTVECRMLPMFKKRALAFSAVQSVLDCYNEYLLDDSVSGDRAPVLTPAQIGRPHDSTKNTQRRAREKLERYKLSLASPSPPHSGECECDNCHIF